MRVSCVTVEDPPNGSSLDHFHETQAAKLRSFNLAVPIENAVAAACFRRALHKLRGVFVLQRQLRTVQSFGTRSGLLDTQDQYKVNLDSLMSAARKQVQEAQESLKSDIRGVIHPNAAWLNWWNIVVLVIMLYSFLLVPYLIAFEDVSVDSPWFVIDIIVDFLFCLDILITANTAFFRGNELITSRRAIFLNYLHGMLVIDCVSTFPLYLVMMPLDSGSSKSNSLIRFLRVTKLSKLCRATKMLKVVKYFSTSQAMEKFVSMTKKHSGIMRLIWTLNLVAIISHFTACMWFYGAKLEDFGPDTWVARGSLQNESTFTLYLVSLYWAITTLTTVGFGDIYAKTPLEMVMAMLWMLFGVGFYSFVMGTLSSMITGLDADTAFLEERLQLVDLFAKDTSLPRKTVKEIGAEVSAMTKGATLTEDQREEFIWELSRPLRRIVVKQMHDCAAARIELLSNLNSNCLQKILSRMTRRKLPSQETIYVKGDSPTHVYFLLEGRVRFVFAQRKLVFKTVVTGGFFGELEILNRKEREHTTETECECDILMLPKGDFLEQMSFFPELSTKVQEIAKIRVTRDQERMDELLDLIEAVEIRKAMSYKDLAGQSKAAIKRQKSQIDLQKPEGTPQEVSSEASLKNVVTDIRKKASVSIT